MLKRSESTKGIQWVKLWISGRFLEVRWSMRGMLMAMLLPLEIGIKA